MPATPAWCARYLLDRGLVSRAAVHHPGVTVVDQSMSHRAFRVDIGGRPRLFLKAADRLGTEGRDLSVEVAVYRLATTSQLLARTVPHCHYLDEAAGIVVIDAVPGETLAAYLTPTDAPDPRVAALLAAYGEAIARVHQVPTETLGPPPWLLSALEPVWGGYEWLPPACAALLRRVAATSAMREGFRRARDQWRRTCLVHGDLRWANVLVAGPPDEARLRLVDWELACIGDPSWDVGSAIADLVMLLALQRDGGASQAELVAWATPLLAAYRHEIDAAPTDWLSLLDLSVRMAAVRLIQGLVEIGHVDPYQMEAAEPVLIGWTAGLLADSGDVASALALGTRSA